jgi:hypothetical protein
VEVLELESGPQLLALIRTGTANSPAVADDARKACSEPLIAKTKGIGYAVRIVKGKASDKIDECLEIRVNCRAKQQRKLLLFPA